MSRNSIFGLVSVLAAAIIAVFLSWSHEPRNTSVSNAPARLESPSSGMPASPQNRSGSAFSTPRPADQAPTIQAGAATSSTAPRPVVTSTVASPRNTVSVSAVTTTQAAMIDLGKAERMIHDYHTLMGENPVGTNAEIMKAIMGGNQRQATLGPLDGQQLNANGELVDQWGTPYFFHQLSGDHMEIHSAGPDKIMGTSDDLIIK